MAITNQGDEKKSNTFLFSDGMTENEIENYKKILSDRAKTIKKGNDVIHLDYFSGVITQEELQEYEVWLAEQNIQLSCYDHSGVAINASWDFVTHFSIAIAPALIDNILYGVAGNAVWDVIKRVAQAVWNKLRDKKLYQISGTQTVEKTPNFGITASYDKDVRFDFSIPTTLSPEDSKAAFDKILEFLQQQSVERIHTKSTRTIFDEASKQWVIVNEEEEIRKIYNRQQSQHHQNKPNEQDR